MKTETKPAAQVPFARKAAALKASTAKTLPPALAALKAKHQTGAALAPDHGPPPAVRLLNKHQVLAITGITYPTLWQWMRAGKFPRSRILVGKSAWLSTDIDAWLAGLPVRPLKGDKGDAPVEHPSAA